MNDTTPCGVILANTGTPRAPKPRAVRKYLGKFLMDARIAPMNRALWWLVLHLFILPKRGRASAQKYAEIWTDEGSPFMVAHEKIARALEERLNDGGKPACVRLAMSYGEPTMKQALRELQEAGCERFVVLPLYPQSAYSTTGAVSDSVARLAKGRLAGKPVIVPDYHNDSTYIRAIATSITHAGFDSASNDRLLFSYHSIPLTDIEAGDTYELQAGASSLQIAGELGLERKRWTIGYQCRFDKGREWLSPSTKDVLSRWAQAGEGRIFVVCPNFAVDCLETLFDVERELRAFYLAELKRAGHILKGREFVYVPCLGKTKAHVTVLASVLDPHLD